jgi:hypothetical protein
MVYRFPGRAAPLLVGAAPLVAAVAARFQAPDAAPGPAPAHAAAMQLLDTHCSSCHNDYDKVAGFSIYALSPDDVAQGANTALWEKVLRRTSLGEMPPHPKPRPDPAVLARFDGWLESGLDGYGAAHPDPGRATIRRLNRAEYANAVSDLLGIAVNVSADLPPDNSGYGFDNIADVLTVSPTLMDRYITVAGRISALATGAVSNRPFVTSYEVPKDGSILNQGRPAYNERSSDELPIASRGGGAMQYYARYDATYEITGTLNANTNNETDREKEDRVSVRVPLKAGPHVIGLSFPRSLAPDGAVQKMTNTTDAVRGDVAGRVYTDNAKVHQIDFAGEWYKVKGPLNVPPSAQGRPVLAQAGASPRGRRFAAKHADIVLTPVNYPTAIKAFRDDIRRLAAEQGRDPDTAKVMAQAFPHICDDAADVARLRASLDAVPDRMVEAWLAQVSAITGIDLAQYDLDQPLPDHVQTNGSRGTLDWLRSGGATVRQIALRLARLTPDKPMIGTADEIAAEMEQVMDVVGA